MAHTNLARKPVTSVAMKPINARTAVKPAAKPNSRPYNAPYTTQRSNYGYNTNITQAPQLKLSGNPKKTAKERAQEHSILGTAAYFVAVGAIVVGSVVSLFVINIWTASLSIQSTNLEKEIRYTRQDIQSVQNQINSKGSSIPKKAEELGMVPRDSTINVQLQKNEAKVSQNTLEDPKNAPEVATRR